ncbi:spore germination protein A1 [Desulfosporosinus acididurans]|uniref:Spore germination protein A1 n=2 Tax=Desulfosporosinus acididurans TaxID=476652 RepID=A0A0J1FNI5_9FIRM|nr:spore germination protein A1 [Desulfosporosinus acididurans]
MAMTEPKNEPLPPISTKLEDNINYLNELLGVGQGPGHSWDIMAKSFNFSKLNMMSYVLNGYFLTMNVVLILDDLEKRIQTFVTENESYTLHDLMNYLNTNVAFVQVQPVTKMEDVVRFILSGPMVTFVDGYDAALLIDTRIYPMRSIQEPEIERVVRGPRDGFTETMLMNTALIRRRLREPSLRAELMQVGLRSKTDVSLMYLEDVANPDTVKTIRERLESIQTDIVAMAEQSVTELIGNVKWNPYPIVRYTERPDVAATALVEGHVVIVVDTSPEVIIAPITFFQLLQHPEEYHQYPSVGTYRRWTMLIAAFITIFLPGLFLLVNFHSELVPKQLAFFKADRTDPLPLWLELIVAEVAIDILRLAVMTSPLTLASMVSIMAAIIFGQFVSQIHLLQPEVLVYMAFVMVAQFSLTSYDLASANQLSRLFILVCTQLGFAFHLRAVGFGVAVFIWLVYVMTRKSFGIPYFWPLMPFKWKNGMDNVLLRKPFTTIHGRPGVLRPKIQKRDG